MRTNLERKFASSVMGLWMLRGTMAYAAEAAQLRPGFRFAASYLPPDLTDVTRILPPYPTPHTVADEADLAALRLYQQSGNDAMRWTLAVADQELTYTRFEEAFGSPIDAETQPRLVLLLDRVEASMTAALKQGKKGFSRPRPYQRMKLERVCGFAKPPAPEVEARGSSYPSGHAVFGWGAVLTLAEVAPERASLLLSRGREYAEGRLVCGVHHPSDIAAGELLAGTVFGKIATTAEFQHDLQCAREEQLIGQKKLVQFSSQCAAANGGTRSAVAQ